MSRSTRTFLYYCCLLISSLLLCSAGVPPKFDFSQIFDDKPLADGPSKIHISYGGGNEMIVCWVSPSPSDPSTVKFGTSPNNLQNTFEGTVDSYSYEGYTSGGLHTAVFKNLLPSTTYYYSVGGTNAWSDVFSFKSAPTAGTPGEVSIAFIGDVGADPNSELTFKGLMNLRQAEGIDFIVHAGDLSYANNYKPGGPVWDHYGDLLQPLASTTPYCPAVGNHEIIDKFLAYTIRYATDAMAAPSSGGPFYWSFDYGLVHMIFLSSETDVSVTSPQYAWLKNDLIFVDPKVTPWVFATWHSPWYNSNEAHQGDGEDMRQAFEPLFKGVVDAALLGHVHAYERNMPVYDYTATPNATIHITLGHGGTPEGLATKWITKPDYSVFRYAQWGYSRMRVFNATHALFTMWGDTDETKQDETWIIKGTK